jgi:serine/threonine-protein kinase RsbW
MMALRDSNRRDCGLDRWRLQVIHTTGQVQPLIDRVMQSLEALDYPLEDVFAVRLSLEEALVNALKHGIGGDPSLSVQVRCHLTAERAVLEVQDQGEGFRPDEVPDPRDPEYLERDGGRGLLLMRHYMTAVWFNDAGNCVTLYKERSRCDPREV